MIVEPGWGSMAGRRELKSIGEVIYTLYTALPKLTVVAQALFLCLLDSGLERNI